MGVFKQGDVVKQMFQKGYKISFRMYLNLFNARIDVENRVYGEVHALEFTFLNNLFRYVESYHAVLIRLVAKKKLKKAKLGS